MARSLPVECFNVFVGNVPLRANHDDVRDVMSQFGDLVDVHKRDDKVFAFVKFRTAESRDAALAAPGLTVLGEPIRCERPKEVVSVELSEIPSSVTEEALRAAVDKALDEPIKQLHAYSIQAFEYDPAAGRAYVSLANGDVAQHVRDMLMDFTIEVDGRSVRIPARHESKPLRDAPRGPAGPESVRTLFIRNLSDETTDADLRAAFEPYGAIDRCNVARDSTGRPRGYGFVDYVARESAVAAVDKTRDLHLHGNHLSVELARPKNVSGGGSEMRGSSSSSSIIGHGRPDTAPPPMNAELYTMRFGRGGYGGPEFRAFRAMYIQQWGLPGTGRRFGGGRGGGGGYGGGGGGGYGGGGPRYGGGGGYSGGGRGFGAGY